MAKAYNNIEEAIVSCADYDSQAEEEVADSRKLADISLKSPSHLSDMPKMSFTQRRSGDVASDSGYSSRTQASISSYDSAEMQFPSGKIAGSRYTERKRRIKRDGAKEATTTTTPVPAPSQDQAISLTVAQARDVNELRNLSSLART
jgi:hypothetical protein